MSFKAFIEVALVISFTFILQYSATAQQPVIITYAGGYRGNLLPVEKIQADKLTHLLYAFANLDNRGEAFLNYPRSDSVNLVKLVALKQYNARLKILLSVGGLGWSVNFSGMASTAGGRARFAKSCVELVAKYKLDGIDLDWEFPGYAGEGGNPFRPEDKQNFTLLCASLRNAFDESMQLKGKRILLTAAVDGWAPHFLPHTEMDRAQVYLDYVCLMSYNFNCNGLAGGHYLYSPAGWDRDGSVDGAVKDFLAAGVPASKLVAGAGFFPAATIMKSSNPENRNYTSKIRFRGGLAKVNRMIGHDGFNYYWEEEGQSPWLFNPKSRIRIAYEDSVSVKAKCDYVLRKQLAGIMYWDYFSDPGQQLLDVIYKTFSK